MSDKKKKITTRKATKVVGTQTYINQQTGEINEMQVINIEERDANFHKIWLGHIIESLDLIGNKKIKILSFVMQNINSDNLFLMTYDEIGQKVGVSKPTVIETMKALQEADFLRKVRNGQYQINPDVIFKGGKNNRLNVLIQYQSNEKRADEQKKDEQSKED